MLQNLSSNVRECLQRAKECAERAKHAQNPALQRDFIDMEARWLKLARSNQFSEQLQTFTSHNEGQRTLISERLERLTRYLANKSEPPQSVSPQSIVSCRGHSSNTRMRWRMVRRVRRPAVN